MCGCALLLIPVASTNNLSSKLAGRSDQDGCGPCCEFDRLTAAVRRDGILTRDLEVHNDLLTSTTQGFETKFFASVLLSDCERVSVHDRSHNKEFVVRRDPATARSGKSFGAY